jgi:hypothetical protein
MSWIKTEYGWRQLDPACNVEVRTPITETPKLKAWDEKFDPAQDPVCIAAETKRRLSRVFLLQKVA